MKCVIVIDASLSTGLIANTAAVLSLTLGEKIDGIIGPDVLDRSGNVHIGITTIPIPILKGDLATIRELRNKVELENFSDVLVVDFSNVAQITNSYDGYTKKISKVDCHELDYLGIALYGEEKKVNKLTGSLGLLR
ncbi:DUF2000 domain-containing protein [Bacillus solimangrovi]|nr:DUF2000 domain-containing protein [Bacillus solimangrovi]